MGKIDVNKLPRRAIIAGYLVVIDSDDGGQSTYCHVSTANGRYTNSLGMLQNEGGVFDDSYRDKHPDGIAISQAALDKIEAWANSTGLY